MKNSNTVSFVEFFSHLILCVFLLTYLFVGAELHDAVFVVGALEETVVLRGMRYHPIDIENTVMRCHQKVAEW